jgi:hypothetical protein
VVGNTNSKIKALKLEVDSLDSQKESRDLSVDELNRNNTIAFSLRNLYRV